MHMKRGGVLVVNPGGRDQIYQSLGNELTAIEPPLWVRLISGYLQDRQVPLSILDTEAEGLGAERAAQSIVSSSPGLVIVVAFGHQPSASTQTMVGASALIDEIKLVSPDTPVLLVGGHVSALPSETLDKTQADYVCQGEGTLTSHELWQALQGECELEAVRGLVRRSDGGVVFNPKAPISEDLDADLHGNVWHLLPMEKYRAHNWQCFGELESRRPYASIYTTLGCPYKCVFCCINAPFDSNRYRTRSPENVVAEVRHLYETYGVKTFKIIDEMFVLKKRHYVAICEGLAALPFANELNIWAYARVDTVKDETLPLLRKAGIRWLALGIESGSEVVRDGAEKSFSQDDIRSIVKSIQNADINVMGNFIFGLPDDDQAAMQATLDLALELQCEFINFYSAMAYPGSQLYVQAKQHGWQLPETWSGFSQHSYDCLPLPTNYISAREVLAFRDDAFHRYFDHEPYLAFVEQKFGKDTRQHIEKMASTRLSRKLIDDAAMTIPAVEKS
ncbi:B12-binding domain-containing radical SAM protein [Marinomonas atlantica]|uniref:B12-binding domain-containing radical SAM protein n=1 Tax=Marinomonas atlantica TaxID=1806668 RepID=UPI000ACE61BD|nr:radical SAM protein [Marinomonas atlantica]